MVHFVLVLLYVKTSILRWDRQRIGIDVGTNATTGVYTAETYK